jgi:UPF0271 protein
MREVNPMKKIDINSDIGESFGNYKLQDDEAVIKYITTANVACGFHAGDPIVMRNTVNLVKKYGVAIGAHPGLPDLMGFGRRRMMISVDDAKCYTIYQVGALKAFVEAAKMKLNHVKPHGAFYTVTKFDDNLARAVLEGILDIDPKLLFYMPGPLPIFKYPKIAEEMGIKVIGEFYADLPYNSDGTINIQRLKQAEDPMKVAQKVIKFMDTGKVTAVDGKEFEFTGDVKSICVHGDTPNVVEVLQTLRRELKKANIEVVPVRQLI